MANDEEALRAAIEANGGTIPKASTNPPMATWSTEAGLIAAAVNELRALKSVFIQANSKPGSSAPNVEPVPTPETAWPKIEQDVRLRRHRELVARLIPSVRRDPVASPD